jgi:replicative DNA helicase
MTEEVKEEYQHWEKEEVMVDPVETTEVDVDPIVSAKVAYIDNLQQEIQGIQEQMASLQYQLDIRVTALAAYQSTLEPEAEEEPKSNGEDKEDESDD